MRHYSSLIIMGYNTLTRILLCVWTTNWVLGNSKPKNSWQDLTISILFQTMAIKVVWNLEVLFRVRRFASRPRSNSSILHAPAYNRRTATVFFRARQGDVGLFVSGSDLLHVQTTTFQFRGGHACCALHCRVSCLFINLFKSFKPETKSQTRTEQRLKGASTSAPLKLRPYGAIQIWLLLLLLLLL